MHNIDGLEHTPLIDLDWRPCPFDGWERALATKEKDRDNPEPGQDPTYFVAHPVSNNLTIIFQRDPNWEGAFTLNEFTGQIEIRWPWWVDRDTCPPQVMHDVDYTRVQDLLGHAYRAEWSPAKLVPRVEMAAHDNPRHPVRDYLYRCRDQWDHEMRLDRLFLDHFGASQVEEGSDERLMKLFAVKHLIGAVARVMAPGTKKDEIVILQGAQGAGKSRGIRALNPEPSWVFDSALDMNSKDGPASLRGRWHIEIAELDALRKTAMTKVKQFLSLNEDQYRPPYGRVTITVPRQCVFWGTTNDSHFLQDRTGNRRFWVVPCGIINVDRIKRDRDLLWGEAVWRYENGEAWHLNAEEYQLQQVHAEEWMDRDAWNEPIVDWVAGRQGFSTVDVWTEALGNRSGGSQTLTRSAEMRIGGVLRDLGFDRQRQQVNGVRTYRWYR